MNRIFPYMYVPQREQDELISYYACSFKEASKVNMQRLGPDLRGLGVGGRSGPVTACGWAEVLRGGLVPSWPWASSGGAELCGS